MFPACLSTALQCHFAMRNNVPTKQSSTWDWNSLVLLVVHLQYSFGTCISPDDVHNWWIARSRRLLFRLCFSTTKDKDSNRPKSSIILKPKDDSLFLTNNRKPPLCSELRTFFAVCLLCSTIWPHVHRFRLHSRDIKRIPTWPITDYFSRQQGWL